MTQADLELSGRPLLATPPDQRLFVDRDAELERIERAVRSRTNTLVLGHRGVGKTTLLRMAEDRVRQTARTLWIEGQLATDPVDVIALVRYRVNPRDRVDWAAFGESAASLQYRSRPQSQRLLEMLDGLRKSLDRRGGSWVVFLDELTSADVAHTLFGRLRDELWQLPLTWVVSGNAADRQSLLRPPADAFFPNVVDVEPLSDGDAWELLRKRVPDPQASDELLRAIVAEAGGIPRRLIRLANDTLVSGGNISETSQQRARRDAVVAELGDAAARVAAELEANGPASASDEQFLARLGMGRSRAAQVLSALERAGVVRGASDRSSTGSRRKVYSLVER